jgi:lysophospholipase L1-like esterase
VVPRLLLAAASCIVFLLVAEGGLRLAAHLASRERGQLFDPELGWRLAPNLRRKVGRYWSAHVPAWTNSRGWRDAETSFERQPGRQRIVALGDSFTFGVSVDYGERFTELLERSFPRLEVVNLGVNAYGTDQELRVLELEGVRYRPDVVILTTFLGNDLDDIRYERRFYWPRPHYELEEGRLRLVRPRLTWDVRLRSSSYLGELGLRFADRFVPDATLAERWRTSDTVPLYLALVRRIKEVCHEHGAHLLVVVTGHPPRRADEERVLQGLAQAGIPTLPTADLFAFGAREGEHLFAKDGHWSAVGHRRVAEAMAGALRSRGWLR